MPLDSNLQLNHPPSSPPPEKTPRYCPSSGRFPANTIGLHLNDFIYVWLRCGNSFWMFPVDLIGDIIFCYAWDGLDWNYILLKSSLIDSFCQGGGKYAG